MFTELLCRIEDSDPSVRDRAYEEIGDLLESVPWSDSFKSVIATLVKRVGVEHDQSALESLLNALVRFASRGEPIDSRVFDLIASKLESLPNSLLTYAFEILALTHDRRFEPVLKRFSANSSPALKEAAAEALVELQGRIANR